jgi:hypothetical protein
VLGSDLCPGAELALLAPIGDVGGHVRPQEAAAYHPGGLDAGLSQLVH